jgi:hypothetical protein
VEDERRYGCSQHRNRGATKRTVLTPKARRFVIDSALKAIHRRLEQPHDMVEQIRASLTRSERDVENLMRAVEVLRRWSLVQ